MWRVIHSIGRGFRSVRPSQCCSQDCSEEDFNKCHNHHYHHYYNEVSKAHAATLRHYSTSSWWSPLTIRRNYNSLGGITCSSTQAVCLCHSSFSKVGEGIHTGSYDNGSSGTERRDSTGYHPRCPPWHWHILQDNQKLEECSSEKEEGREEKQNTKDWRKTCHSQEWKEILQSSSTLHALGWGSAAALTLSLYRNWSEHHPCPYLKKNEQQQKPNRVNSNHNSNNKDVKKQDQKNEETWNYHKPFKDFFSFESKSQKSSSQSPDSENDYKSYLGEIYEVPNLQCKFESKMIYKPNLVKSHEYLPQETIIPVYSLQEKFLDMARKVFSTQESDHVEEKDKLKDICKDEVELHDVSELPVSLKDEWSNVLDKTDSGCLSDFSQSFQSQTCSTKVEIAQNQYNQSEESNVSKTVLVISPESPVTEASASETPAEEEDVSEHYQTTAQKKPVNNYADDNKMKMLHDKLLEVVKAHHEERLSDMLKKGEKTLLDTKPEEMVVYFQAATLMGDTTSAFNLALCYHMGHGVTQDLEKARELYEAASAAGHGWATYNLAVMLSQGLGGPLLPQKSHSLLVQAAKMGVREAQEVLSVLEEEKQQQTVPQKEEDEPHVRQCYSEPCLLSFLTKEWPSSYSTGDLQALLDEDDWTGGDLSTVGDVPQKM